MEACGSRGFGRLRADGRRQRSREAAEPNRGRTPTDIRLGAMTASGHDGERRWALVGEPLFREVGDEVFVLTRDSQMHWLKNATARFLWERLVAAGPAGCSASGLALSLSGEFEVDELQARPDVVRFCEHLARCGLASVVMDEPGPKAAGEAQGGPGRG